MKDEKNEWKKSPEALRGTSLCVFSNPECKQSNCVEYLYNVSLSKICLGRHSHRITLNLEWSWLLVVISEQIHKVKKCWVSCSFFHVICCLSLPHLSLMQSDCTFTRQGLHIPGMGGPKKMCPFPKNDNTYNLIKLFNFERNYILRHFTYLPCLKWVSETHLIGDPYLLFYRNLALENISLHRMRVVIY